MKTMLKGMSKEAYNDLAAEVADDVDDFRRQRDQEKN